MSDIKLFKINSRTVHQLEARSATLEKSVQTLIEHKAEFKLLVMEKLNTETANTIEWDGNRLLCIAGDFTKYDRHAVQQINRNIELEKGFTRDVRTIGHYGTGELEVTLRQPEDLERSQPLLLKSYEATPFPA